MGDFYTREQLLDRGFSEVGAHVRISCKTSIYAASGTIGSHVRVDDFCILKGRLEIGSFVHICAYCSLSGTRGTVRLRDFCSIANRTSIYTGTDDYAASALSSAVVPQHLVATITGDVTLEMAALIGAHCVILPGVTVGEGASVGAQCVIHRDVPAGEYWARTPPGWQRRGSRSVERIRELAEQARRAACPEVRS